MRCGLHYGKGEAQYDAVTKGYDYYGTVVNAAARIESVCHGGQVGVSEAFWEAVGGSFAGTTVVDLGDNELRGLNGPLRLYQVRACGGGNRIFTSGGGGGSIEPPKTAGGGSSGKGGPSISYYELWRQRRGNFF